MHGLQFLVFDARRGNGEAGGEDKLLAWYPVEKPASELIRLVGLLQGLQQFCSRFEGAQDGRWLSTQTDRSTWLSYEPEDHLFIAMTVPTLLLPRHFTEINLRGILLHGYRVIRLLHSSLAQATLNKPPSECQELLGPVLRSLTTQLSNPAPWLSRELRNPLAAFEAPPTVRVPSATALCASRICSTAAYVARCAPPLGPMLLLDHRVLWSGLQAEETADVHALLQLGAVAAPPTTAPILAPAGAPRRPAAEAGAAADPPADGGAAASSAREALGPGLCWQQVALSTGAGLDCEPRLWVWREPAPAHGGPPTSHPAGSSVRGVPRGWLREASGERRCFTLAMLVFGRLLLVVPMDLAASAMDIATLHACVLPEIEILQKMVQRDSRLDPSVSGHVPGYRYVLRVGGRSLSSPRVKVSAMTHHTRALAVAVLGLLPPDEMLSPRGNDESLDAPAPSPSDDYPRVVLARSAQGHWVAASLDDRSRMLAIRERRGDISLSDACSSLDSLRHQLPDIMG